MNIRISHGLWLAIAFVCGTAVAAEEIRWAPDLDSARNASSKFKVPLLVHFYGDHCLPCKTLEHRVYSRPELIDTLNKYFICVRINASQERAIAEQFNIHSWPTDVFLSPDGSTIYQGVCKQDLNGYIATLHNVAVMNRDRNAMHTAAAASPPPANPATGLPVQNNGFAPTTQVAAINQQLPQHTAPSATLPAYGSSYGPQYGQTPQGFAPQSSPTQGFAAATGQQPVMQTPQGSMQTQNVAHGPLTAANQPQSIASSTSRQNLLIAGPTKPVMQNGQLAGGRGQPQAFVATNQALPTSTGPISQQQPLSAVANVASVNYPSINGAGATNQLSAQTATAFNPAQSQNPGVLISNPFSQDTAPAAAQSNLPSYQRAVTTGTAAAMVSAQPISAQVSGNMEPVMRGYCVIRAKEGEWVSGSPEFAVKHRGQLYWLSDKASQASFLANPDKAAPALSGYDPMILLTEGKFVPGKIDHTLHERMTDQLLLFSSEASKQAFYPENDQGAFDRHVRALKTLLSEAGQ